jgi:hypothetical protein
MTQKPLHITCVGPTQSGKTTYIRQIMGGPQNPAPERTIGASIDFFTQNVDGHPRHLHIWEIGDSCPREPKIKKEIIQSNLKSADLVLVFCDLNDPLAYQKIAEHFSPKKLKAYCGNPRAKFALIATETPQHIPGTINQTLQDFTDKHDFDIYFTPATSRERVSSLNESLKMALDARREALKARVERYHNYRLVEENLKNLVAYVAWFLGLSYFFGHSRKDDKVTAANALINALNGTTQPLAQLTKPQEEALKHDRLGSLYQEAEELIEERVPRPVSLSL